MYWYEGLLWWINRSLHLFGWALIIESNDTTNEIVDVYPAKVDYRGFTEEVEDIGFEKMETFLKEKFHP